MLVILLQNKIYSQFIFFKSVFNIYYNLDFGNIKLKFFEIFVKIYHNSKSSYYRPKKNEV